MRWWTAVVGARLLGAVVVVLAVLGPVRAAGAEEVTVRIGDGLDPKELTVAPGTTVRWVNQDGERHRVRSNGGATSFDSGNLEPGQSFTATFPSAGRTTYLDDRNREDAAYHGAVTVTGGITAPAPTPTDAPAASPSSSVTITMANRAFTPASVVVAPGGTITWRNADDRTHTGTADAGAFDTGDLAPGASATTTHPTEGTFAFHCDLHPEMTGIVRVASSGGAPPPAPAPPATTPPSAPPPSPAATTPSRAVGPTARSVQIGDLFFSPATLDARVGDTVTWANGGRAPHTVTSASFDSGRLAAGANFRWTPAAAGTVDYRCTIHPEMTGRLRVVEASAAAPAVVATAPATTTTTAAATTTTTSSAAPVATEAKEVEVVDLAFEPASTRIEVGGTVTWRFTGSAPHSVTAGDGAFDSGVVDQGATFAQTFDTAGTHAYSCVVHPTMKGTIEVVLASATSPAGAVATTTEPRDGGSGRGQAWLVALLGAAGILGGTGVLLGGARRFLVAAGS